MKMKSLSFLIVAGLSLLMPTLQSCSVDDDDVFDASTDPTVCPEPMRFSFDAQGMPYFVNQNLSSESRKALEDNVLGYGWKYMTRNEILEDGSIDPESGMVAYGGPGRYSFYLDSSTLTRFIQLTYVPEDRSFFYHKQHITLNKEQGLVKVGNDAKMRIWSIYKVNDQWFLGTVESNYLRMNPDNGQYYSVWEWVQYKRMSPSELKDYRKKYNQDFERINAD